METENEKIFYYGFALVISLLFIYFVLCVQQLFFMPPISVHLKNNSTIICKKFYTQSSGNIVCDGIVYSQFSYESYEIIRE